MVRVLSAGWFLVGRPVSTNDFIELNKQGLVRQQLQLPNGRTPTADERTAAVKAADDGVRQLGPAGGQVDALNLSSASLHILGAARLEMPAVRIELRSISAWWLCQPRVVTAEQKSGSGSFGVGVGVVVPFDW